MKKSLIFSFVFFIIILLSMSFVSASWFDDLFSGKYSGNVIQKAPESSQTFIRKGELSQIPLDSDKYTAEIKNIIPSGEGKSFVRVKVNSPSGTQEEVSVREGESANLQEGKVISFSRGQNRKFFGEKAVEIKIENKLEEVEGVLFFSHFHENVGTPDETSGDEYLLYSDAGIYKIEIAPEDEIMNMRLEQMIGNNIKASGLKKDNTISIKSVSASTKLEDSAKRLTQTNDREFRKPFSPPIIIDNLIPAIKNQTRYKMAVFLIDFQDSGARPFTRSEAEEKLFNSAGSLRGMIQEQSYNKASVTGKVFDWITVPRNSQDPPFSDSPPTDPRCYAGAESNFIYDEFLPLIPQTTKESLKEYNRIYFYTYCPQYQFNLGGYATSFFINLDGGEELVEDVDSNEEVIEIVGGFTMFNFNNFPSAWPSVLKHQEHEFIHYVNGLVPHAAFLDCGEKSLGRDEECSFLEAGNCFDIMGKVLSTGICSEHVNAVFKENIGWLSERDILTITKSGNYTLSPLESSGRTKKAAKIEISGFPFFYLEFRQPIGMDSNLNNPDFISNQDGLFIYYRMDGGGFSLIDMQPTAFDWEEDVKEVTLNGANTFFYNLTNFNITIGPIINVKKSVPQEITFEVKINRSLSSCASTFTDSKPFILPFSYFNNVYFINSNNGWVITNNGKLYSYDGENSWKLLQTGLPNDLLSGKVYFISQNIGWVIGYTGENKEGIIFHTTDGGNNWIKQFGRENFIPRDIQFINHSVGWMVGDLDGGVFKTIDGGETWQQEFSYPENFAYKSYFIDSENGWILPLSSFTYVYSTNDRGQTWLSQSPASNIWIRDFYFLNQTLGWLTGYNYDSGEDFVFKTIDGGQSWISIPISSYVIEEIQFNDSSNGWAIGFDYSGKRFVLLSTHDGGQTWLEVFAKNQEFYNRESNSYFLDSNRGWLNTGKEIYCLNEQMSASRGIEEK